MGEPRPRKNVLVVILPTVLTLAVDIYEITPRIRQRKQHTVGLQALSIWIRKVYFE